MPSFTGPRGGGRRIRIRGAALALACVLALLPAEKCLADTTAGWAASEQARALTALPNTNDIPVWPKMGDISEDAAVLLDVDSGAVLYAKDALSRRYPASTTKIMTCLLVLENAAMDEIVTMTEVGMEAAYSGSSNCNPVLGEQFTIEQCLYMLMLKSANDIALELANHVGGSPAAFVDMMNARAAEIGCKDTHFNNPHGLPDDNHYTTPYDLALILRECLENEGFRQLIATRTYTVPATNMTPGARTYDNHCKLIMTDSPWHYDYALGGKTGYTDAAWRTLVAAAEKDGRTLAGVTMHGPTDQDFGDMRSLFEFGFANFTSHDLKNEDKGITEGAAALPNGMSTAIMLASEGEADESGRSLITYTASTLPAGFAIRQEAPAPALTDDMAEGSVESGEEAAVSSGQAEAEAEATSSEGTQTKKSSPVLRILAGLGVVVLVLAAALGIWMLIRARIMEARRERRRRRRRAARRRRMEEEE